MYRQPIKALFLLLLILSAASAQHDPHQPGIAVSTGFTVAPRDTTIELGHEFLIPGSEVVIVSDSVRLSRNINYTIDYRRGLVAFWIPEDRHTDMVRDSLRLSVSYRYLPLTIRDEYRLYEIIEDTTGGEPATGISPVRSFSIDDIFSSDLRASGSLIRGLNVGTNRDLSLQSGFRMQLSGKLSDNIDIAATLTDENTPIQPEGTTQTLRELDKVFIEISGSNAAATLGDFDFKSDPDRTSEFVRINRRLQGAMGTYSYREDFGSGSAVVAGATMRGKFNTNEFRGLEGVQGPYRLTGKNNERAIVIVPGSERVFIDGQPMTRGETNDYTIEYGNGELIFTAQRLITSASRITVDFEYTDRQYTRNFFAAGTRQSFVDDRLTLDIGYYREGDDQNSPIDIVIGEEERSILEESGTDRLKASRSSVRFVGVDTTTGRGSGQYIQRDTTVNGAVFTYYIFDPAAPEAVYSIGFSFVGEGMGEYRRIAAGQFEWRGPGGGGYLPIQFLPMPQLHQVLNTAMNVSPASSLNIFGEYSYSNFDGNRFSIIDDEFNRGGAYLAGLRYAPKEIKLFGSRLGAADLRFRQRFIERNYEAIDRINEIEFGRQWDLPGEVTGNELIREISAAYNPVREVTLRSGYGTLKLGETFDADRFDALFEYTGTALPQARYYIESINSSDGIGNRRGSWIRQRGNMHYAFSPAAGSPARIVPGVEYEREDREIGSSGTDTLIAGSFSFTRVMPRITFTEVAGMNLTTEAEFREDREFLGGSIVPESKSFTSRSFWQLSDWNTLSSRTDFTYRKKWITESFIQEGRGDAETILIRNQTRFAPLRRSIETDLFYEVTTQRSSRLERVFVRVPQGTGNYRYLGDLNNNGIADENEFELVRFDGDYIVVTVPTDELFPVVDLRTSVRFRLTPSRLFGSGGSGTAATLVKLFSSETYVRLEEKSRDPRTSNLYLIRLSTFQDENFTIAGSRLLTQDVFINEQSREFSLRFRYMKRRGMNQYSLGVERSSFIERSVRLRWQLVEEIGHQVDVIHRRDNVAATQPSNRERRIVSNTILSDLTYRPHRRVEAGFVLELTSAEDTFPMNPITASINAQTLRLVFSMQARGQLRTEFSRELVALRQQGQDAESRFTLPFELTGGRVEGLSWLWRAAFDYRISRFIQSTVQYDGRAEENRPIVHQGRAEVRVFF